MNLRLPAIVENQWQILKLTDSLNKMSKFGKSWFRLQKEIFAVLLVIFACKVCVSSGQEDCEELDGVGPDNYCYYLVNNPLSFDNASTNCQDLGAELYIPNDREIFEQLRNHPDVAASNTWWIGGREKFYYEWRWTRDQPLGSYEEWKGDAEPSPNGTKRCVAHVLEIDETEWWDTTCTDNTNYVAVCQKQIDLQELECLLQNDTYYDGSQCYQIELTLGGTLTWFDAQELCGADNATLPVIENAQQSQRLTSYLEPFDVSLTGNGAWLSLHSAYLEFINGEEPTFYVWGNELTQVAEPGCLVMSYVSPDTGDWVIKDCDEIHHYICTKAIVTTASMTTSTESSTGTDTSSAATTSSSETTTGSAYFSSTQITSQSGSETSTMSSRTATINDLTNSTPVITTQGQINATESTVSEEVTSKTHTQSIITDSLATADASVFTLSTNSVSSARTSDSSATMSTASLDATMPASMTLSTSSDSTASVAPTTNTTSDTSLSVSADTTDLTTKTSTTPPVDITDGDVTSGTTEDDDDVTPAGQSGIPPYAIGLITALLCAFLAVLIVALICTMLRRQKERHTREEQSSKVVLWPSEEDLNTTPPDGGPMGSVFHTHASYGTGLTAAPYYVTGKLSNVQGKPWEWRQTIIEEARQKNGEILAGSPFMVTANSLPNGDLPKGEDSKSYVINSGLENDEGGTSQPALANGGLIYSTPLPKAKRKQQAGEAKKTAEERPRAESVVDDTKFKVSILLTDDDNTTKYDKENVEESSTKI